MNLLNLANTIVTLFLMLLSTFGNGLVMISVKRFEWLRSPTFYFVALLAFFDFLNAFPPSVMVVVSLMDDSPGKNITSGYTIYCKITFGFLSFSSAGNLVLIIIITMDRYLYITKPLRYIDIVTNRKALNISTFVFLFCLISSFFTVYNGSSIMKRPCSPVQVWNGDIVRYFMVPLFVFAILMIIALYGKIAHISWKARKTDVQAMPQHNQSGAQNKITKVIVPVIGVFTVTYITIAGGFLITSYWTGQNIWIPTVARFIWLVSVTLLFIQVYCSNINNEQCITTKRKNHFEKNCRNIFKNRL